MAIQVFLLDGATQIGEITTFETVEAIETDLAAGSWVVRMSRSASPVIVEAALRATWLGLEIVDTATGWRLAGPATKRIRTYTRPSSTARDDLTLEIRGVDMMDYLDAALEWPDSADVTRWWITSTGAQPLSTAATNTLHFQVGPEALPVRRIPNLNIVDPPAPFGPTKSWVGTGQPLSELFRPWYHGTDWTYRLALWRSGNATPEVRFTTNARAVAPQIITPQLQDSITVTETAATATFVAGIGEQIPAQPQGVRYAIGIQGTETTWLTRRREIVINRPSSDLPTLTTEATDAVTTGGPRITAQIADFEITGYGDTVQLGDFVRLSYDPAEPTLLLPITSSRLTGDATGWKRTVSVGQEALIGPRQLAANYEAISRRVRRIEGELH